MNRTAHNFLPSEKKTKFSFFAWRTTASPRGFTLVEVLVSVMIFSVVMTVALGALLSMSESDRRAQALKSVINNLNFALEGMSRTIRTGYYYHCGASGSDLSTPAPQDCSAAGGGQPYLALRAADGSLVAYCLNNGTIKRQVLQSGTLSTDCSSSNFFPLTSSEVTVTDLQFIVVGSCPGWGGGCTGDSIQPKVTVLLRGSVKASPTQTTPLNLQTTITQRIFDQ